MALSNELISQFAKLVKEEKKPDNGTTVYGKIVVESDGQKYVLLDGSDFKTPITEEDDLSKESSTTDVKDGDRVSVIIKNHTATVTGNISSPATNKEAVTQQIQEYDILIGEKITANEAYIKQLQTEKASVLELQAAEAEITKLKAKDVEITGTLEAQSAEITNLEATKIDASVVEANYATIEELNVMDAKVRDLEAYSADIEELKADNVTINNTLDAHKATIDGLDANYANIDFSNITEATISKLFTDYGVIKELIIEGGTVVKELVGVTIKGDLVEAGTLKADRLVVKGSDGNYYALNTDFEAMPGVTPVEEDAIHGSVLVKKSIVAEKISVSDLVAFGATIGGFHITNNAIYSGVKASVDNTTTGIYQDRDGQFAVGDGTNFLKYYKDADGNYKFEVSASEIRLGASSMNVEDAIADVQSDIDNLEVGGRNLLRFTSDLPLTYDLETGVGSYGTSQPLTSTDEGIKFDVPDNGRGGISIPLIFDGAIQNGEDVTISFDYRGNMTDVGSFYFLQRTTPNVSVNSFPDAIVSEEEWQHYSYTFSSKYANERVCYAVLLCYMTDTEAGKWIEIKKGSLKLERGKHATDWTPAPEDTDSQIDAVKSDQSALGNRTTNVEGSVSDLSATTETIKQNIKSETEARQNAIDGLDSRVEGVEKKVDNMANLVITEDAVAIETLRKISKDGVTYVDSGVGCKFDYKGMLVDKDGSATKTQVTENGMTVCKKGIEDTVVLEANSDGVNATNLKATNYVIINEESRLQAYEKNGKKRTACFWIGG